MADPKARNAIITILIAGHETTALALAWALAEIVCAGNTRHEAVRLRYRDYEALEAPLRARFAIPSEPPRRPAPQRRAG